MHNVLIVDDHPMVSLGIGAIVKKVDRSAELFYAYSYKEAVEELSRQHMDLVVLDLAIPGTKGPDMISSLRAIQQELKILICSGRDELMNAPTYLRCGANGFLHKDSLEGDAENAIQTVLNNRKYISSRVQENMLNTLRDGSKLISDPTEPLTPREREVLRLLLSGKWLKSIAAELNVEVSTVGTQKNKILKKLGADNMLDLAKKIWQFEEGSAANL